MDGVQVSIVGGQQGNADAAGFYQFVGLTDGQQVTVESRLIGEWVTVENGAGAELVTSTTATPPQANVDMVFNPTATQCIPWPSESDTAQVNSYLVVQGTHDWFKNLLVRAGLPEWLWMRIYLRGLKIYYRADARTAGSKDSNWPIVPVR